MRSCSQEHQRLEQDGNGTADVPPRVRQRVEDLGITSLIMSGLSSRHLGRHCRINSQVKCSNNRSVTLNKIIQQTCVSIVQCQLCHFPSLHLTIGADDSVDSRALVAIYTEIISVPYTFMMHRDLLHGRIDHSRAGRCSTLKLCNSNEDQQ